MLVLSRKDRESILIDRDITVTVLRIEGHRVKIGIEAPAGVRVHRKEVCPGVAGPETAGNPAVEAERLAR